MTDIGYIYTGYYLSFTVKLGICNILPVYGGHIIETFRYEISGRKITLSSDSQSLKSYLLVASEKHD